MLLNKRGEKEFPKKSYTDIRKNKAENFSEFWQPKMAYLKTKLVFLFSDRFLIKSYGRLKYLLREIKLFLKEKSAETYNFLSGQKKSQELSYQLKQKCYSRRKYKINFQKLLDKTAKTPVKKIDSGPKVAIIILNRNGFNYLKKLFASIKKNTFYRNYEIVVVDNASQDDSIDYLEKNEFELPLRVIKNKKNVSFASGCNQGARETKSELLVFMNNDLEVTKGWLINLVACYLKNKEEVGSVGAKLVYPATKNFKLAGSIQHAGIRFRLDEDFDFFRPYNIGGKKLATDCSQQEDFPALTAALLLIPRDKFKEVGGFDENYFYGYEDVDLGLKLYKAGYRNIYNPQALAVHYEFGSQEKDNSKEIKKRRKKNIEIFKQKWDKYLEEKIKGDAVSGSCFFRDKRTVALFIVTEAGRYAKIGDYFTARELGEALTEKFGWEIRYQPKWGGSQNWYKVDADVDILISMIDKYNISKITSGCKNLIKIAWVRNWFDRWARRSYLKNFEVILTSSKSSQQYLKENAGLDSIIFPIATNEKRFCPAKNRIKRDKDYIFTGSYYDCERNITKFLDPGKINYRFSVYGNHWERSKKFKPFFKGFMNYQELPRVYQKTKIVLDDAMFTTKFWGSVNSRVFDALACGALVLTDGALGAQETFRGKLPFFKNGPDLEKLLHYYLDNSVEREKKVKELRKFVLENHTYSRRARKLMKILKKKYVPQKIVLKVPVPNWEEVENWGDYHVAVALKKYLQRFNWKTVIQILPEWEERKTDKDCWAALVLRGLSQYNPQPFHFNMLWNISHPDEIQLSEYEKYDQVFIASKFWAEKIREKSKVKVEPMLQCTDLEVFKPPSESESEKYKTEILFVGNSREKFRKSVKYSFEAGKNISVYGTLWKKFISPETIKGEYLPNKDLYKYYGSARVLLNDHWKDMVQKGFVSNRIYDALACGAVVLSDEVKEMDKKIKGALIIYQNEEDFLIKLEEILENNREYKKRALGIRPYLKKHYSFEARAKKIIKKIIEEYEDSTY
jgi:O-antigen biosynthesis protein